ncbi:penicillin-binding protein 1C [Myxococcota bacterium]|nr:penicillin-binding protein 1C [Myxococcota bacterium]
MGRRPALKAARAAALVAVALLAGLLGLAFALPLPARLTLPGSPVVRWQDGQVAWMGLAPDDRWRVPVTVDQVDPALVEALVRLEDKRFWWHPGVDPVAVVRAAGLNVARGQVVSGASTLTMQVVRLAEPRPRTLRSKVVEAARAAQLELRLSKAEILAAWLTLAPFGGNLEGVEAASHAWFGHSAAHLSPAEIATLLAVPQSPTARAPSRANQARLQAARDDIAGRLLALGLLERHLAPAGAPPEQGDGARVTAEQVRERIARTPVPTTLHPMPRAAPHAAAWLLRGQGGTGAQVDTTLDAGVQAAVERVVARAAPGLRARGIEHLAVVVVEHASGRVAALVGGADFDRDRPGAQIPAFAVPRSPGSTLKPLLYARALDRGLYLPESVVLDVPVRYGGYAPENYEGSFDGLVPLEEALSRSLNVPFVRLLQQVGVEPFLGDLRALGAHNLDPRPGHYGLSAIIGGVELSPLEVAGLYTTLARGGSHLPLRWLAETPPEPARRVFGPGATWLTNRALARKDRPDFPARLELSAAPRHVRWKTGTSFGNRDAWAVGSGARYTVAVWAGNLDMRPSAWLVGAEVAGPLLFDVVDALRDGQAVDPGAPGSAPDDLASVTVCALSGALPGPSCPHTRQVLGVQARVPPAACALHGEVEIDRATGLRVGPGCRDGRDTLTEVRVTWPATVRRWLDERWLEQPAAPELDPACRPAAPRSGPRIVSPVAGQVAVLIPGMEAERQELPLLAEADEGTLTWFVDGDQVGRAGAEQALWWTPRPGSHEVLVMDAHGRSDRVRLQVRQGGASPGQIR